VPLPPAPASCTSLKSAPRLLGGGTKKKQQRDIAEAHDLWTLYKAEKKGKT
jgi:hypothetical protein